MTKAQQIAYRLRWLILIAGLLCLAAGLMWITLLDFGWWGVEGMGL